MNRVLIFSFIISVSLNLHSQIFRNLSVKDRLSDLIVNTIYKDSVGYVWFGTSSSVERFDGVYLKRYSIPCSTDKEKEVNTMIGMPNSEIWFGNNSGLWRIDNNDEVQRIAPDKITGKIYSLLYDTSGKLYVGGENGLFIYKDSEVTKVNLEQNALAQANVVKGLAMDNENLWMATLDGLYVMSTKTMSIKSFKPDNKNITTSFHKIYILNNTLYLGTLDSGIVSFNINKGRFEHYMDLGCITSLSGDNNHTIYVGTNGGGIYFIKADNKKIIKNIRHDAEVPEGLHSNSVYSLLVDDMGVIWAGLFQMGVDYTLYQRDIFKVFQHLPEIKLIYSAIRTIEVTNEGMLVGTRDGLFYIDEKRGIYKRFSLSEMRSQMIMSSCFFNGKFYVGTYGGGMYVLDPKTVTLCDFEPGISNPFITGNIFSITSDYCNNLWISTSNGIFRYVDGKMKFHYNCKNSRLPEENIYKIYFDSKHRGWVCADSELLLIQPSEERHITDKFPAGFINRKLIRDIYEDSQHNLYFLPDKGHLFVSDLALSHFKYISKTPLDGKNLQFIIEDDENWLWIGSNDGLFRYDKNKNFIPYNFSDGISSPVFLNCNPKKATDGTLWFGSSQGLIYTHLDKINQSKNYLYPLQITDIFVDDERYQFKKERSLSLKTTFKKLTLHFSGFTFTDPQYMNYEYKLEGEDDQWKILSGVSEKSFYGLSAGDFIFKLRRLGVPESEVSLKFSVSPTFSYYKIIICILLLIAIGSFVFYIIKRRNNIDFQVDISSEQPYSANSLENKDTFKVSNDVENVQKYKSININNEECQLLMERLKKLMTDDKLYINPDLKIADLAHRLDVPTYKLSYLFSQYLNLSFYDYVNDYRIAEFKELVKKGEHKFYTINTLMEQCGFVSRTTFFRYFKKINGQIPSEYIKNQK